MSAALVPLARAPRAADVATAAAAARDASEARAYMRAAAPRAPEAHLVRTALGGHVFVADGSRLFDADEPLLAAMDGAMAAGEGRVAALLDRLGLGGPPRVDDVPLAAPPVHALSLAIAQKCNLGCGYCYAQQGEFGGAARSMDADTAHRAVDLLVGGAEPGARPNSMFRSRAVL